MVTLGEERMRFRGHELMTHCAALNDSRGTPLVTPGEEPDALQGSQLVTHCAALNDSRGTPLVPPGQEADALQGSPPDDSQRLHGYNPW